jgi:DNA-binding protein HU-beta
VNKQELVIAVAEAAGLARSDAARAVDAVLDEVTGALKVGSDVKLVGFGTFHVTHRAASSGRNPRTGEPMQLEARNQPKFTPGKTLRDAIN